MDRIVRDFLIFFFIPITAYSVFGLHCFHCASDKEGSDCETDIKELEKGVFSKYYINCSDHGRLINPVCAIETYKTNEVIQKIVRGCSDGFTFSFDHRLAGLKVIYQKLDVESNVTACGIHQGLVCVSICNTTMCNGPQGAILSFNISNSTGSMMPKSLPLMIGAGITLMNINP